MFSRKDLTRLLIPLMIEQLLAVTIGMEDILMVAPVGDFATSGVSLVDSINMLMVQVFIALATGGAIVTAQYLGHDDSLSACESAQQLMAVTAGCSVAVAAVCTVGRGWILGILYGGIDPAVMQSAEGYFLATALSYPFIALYNAGAALFRAQGNSRVSMAVAFLMNAVNIGFNAIFIYTLKMGAMGAGIGTLFSRIAGAGMVLWLLHNPTNRVYVRQYWGFKLKPNMIKTILGIAVPNGMENGMFHFGRLLLSGLVASFGTVAITANAVANSITSCACVPGNAIGLAMLTVVGQCVGAGDYDEAKRYIRKLVGLAYLVGGIVYALVLLYTRQIVGAFSLGEAAAALAVTLVSIHSAFSIALWPGAFAVPCALRAAGDVKFTMAASMAVMWTFRVGLAYLFGLQFGLGVIGVWLAMVADWVVRTAVFAWRLKSGRWKNRAVV